MESNYWLARKGPLITVVKSDTKEDAIEQAADMFGEPVEGWRATKLTREQVEEISPDEFLAK
jgi:hypothetical protein